MNWKFREIIEAFSANGMDKLLRESRHGLERECLRIDKKGIISQKPHPEVLGAALTNPYITTDFSEAQLELVTPPLHTEDQAAKCLGDIHLFINENLDNELLWPFSMPGKLCCEKKVPLARYGSSRTGAAKTLYRLGLSYRYGRKMQTVSGTHYNFSFSDKLWDFLYKKFAPKQDRQTFISNSYLHLVRNFLRYSWLNTYLFGAAPVADKSYFNKRPKSLKKCCRRTYYGEFATSLRSSDVGYYSLVQSQIAISFNDIESYIKDLEFAISTPSPKYKGLPGLNENMLQIANEHYSRIRPKRSLIGKETTLEAVKKRGIEYVEVRAVDINPYNPLGLGEEQLSFLHVFMVYCLFKESAVMTHKDQKTLTSNQNKVALFGRDPKQINMRRRGIELVKEMRPIALLLDKALGSGKYSKNLEHQLEKLDNPDLTPSAKILADMRAHKETFLKFGLRLAKEHSEFFRSQQLEPQCREKLRQAAEKSFKDQRNIEIIEETFLQGYEDMEISTQMLIREALKRGVKVDILDRKANFIRLQKGRKVEYVKQATETSKDSYITYRIMESKNICRQVLAEHGFCIPRGMAFQNLDEGLEAYEKFAKKKLVIKPTFENHGIGISFIEPGDKNAYEKALKLALSYGGSAVLEEFVSGNEYRFLVLDYKLASIVQRIPANVTGDGKHTIGQLIDIKNADASAYKFFETYYIRKGEVERQHLKSKQLTFKSIPPKGERVFLRTNSNIGTGGDAIEVSDKIPDHFKRVAQQAAKAVKARICGVDMLINGNDYAIIELNFNPALQMHRYPMEGHPVDVAKLVLNLLF